MYSEKLEHTNYPMAYDEALTARIRTNLLTRPNVSEKSMFGGIAFLVNGNMCCGVHKNLLVVRLSAEEGTSLLSEPHVRPMDITGRPMKGWLFIEPKGYEADADLFTWIERAYAFASALPAKKK